MPDAPSGPDGRAAMVQRLRRKGIVDERVLGAMATVPRERFLPTELAAEAYLDRPLPIGAGQTISAPSIVALMAAALELCGTEEVLEVGTGAGYAAAVLGRCGRHVVTIERHRDLADHARAALAALRYDNVEVRRGDGTLGAPDCAPFDAVSVAAMADDIPEPLVRQLAQHGRLVCPVGVDGVGELIRLHGGRQDRLSPVRFVPLVRGP